MESGEGIWDLGFGTTGKSANNWSRTLEDWVEPVVNQDQMSRRLDV
jgi:hypothetical protein